MATKEQKRNNTAFKWRCGCGEWNDISEGVCRKCRAMQPMAAEAYRLHEPLSNEAKGFYRNVVPGIMRDLGGMKALLTDILHELRKLNSKEGKDA